jgi:glycosyltransferase involved in cell wall biosynthesis
MARIAVVIPAYNHGRFVGEAVRSVLVQTIDDLELIVVDDGSTDDTLAVVEAIRDPRLRIITQRNGGTHAAINTGLRAVAAPLIAILNSDDAYEPERLARQARDAHWPALPFLPVPHPDLQGLVFPVPPREMEL